MIKLKWDQKGIFRVLRLGGAPPCPRRVDRRWRPLPSGPGGSHGVGRPRGMGSRHLHLRSSDACEGLGEAFANCCRPTPAPPEETPGATDVARRSPATVGAQRVARRPIRTESVSTARSVPRAPQGPASSFCRSSISGQLSTGVSGSAALGELKEHTGFLVSRSLTVPAAPPDEPQSYFDDFPCTQKTDYSQTG